LGKAVMLCESTQESITERFPFATYASVLEELAAAVMEGLRTLSHNQTYRQSLLSATDELLNSANKVVECLSRSETPSNIGNTLKVWKTKCALFVKTLREYN